MWEDKIVTEVRRAREAYAAKYGYDLRALYQALKAQEEHEEREKVAFPPKHVVAATESVIVRLANSVA
ncbi:MAG TPA: hypothetical protein PLH19_03520 [Anaerolineae bacterium]|nr:hypothetical protein [Anaerolineae bacterium]HQH37591.1 hypothetical protein [Anaerolineae bacterium]